MKKILLWIINKFYPDCALKEYKCMAGGMITMPRDIFKTLKVGDMVIVEIVYESALDAKPKDKSYGTKVYKL